jgi:hypothetical protein
MSPEQIALINTACGLTQSYGERLRGCNPRSLNPEKAQRLSPGTANGAGTAAEGNRIAQRVHPRI